jgi:formylglycine-generating enzyme required for sulfatase activity/serine/threonine protein kinase
LATSSERSQRALELFAALLSSEGLSVDVAAVERLATRNADVAAELRELWTHWSKVATAVPTAPSSAASLAQRLEAVYGHDVDPGVSLEAPTVAKDAGAASGADTKAGGSRSAGASAGGSLNSTASGRMVGRMSERAKPASRYTVQDELGRGGMGVVYDVWDEDLHRHLAMKVIRGKGGDVVPPGSAPTPPTATPPAAQVDPTSLGRFLEEAQITSQLSHPGIVPVHEIGLDPHGNIYFTMRLVRGHTFGQVIEWVAKGESGWNLTRALGVLVDVCDALAFAHDKGVVHRDLKPGNVMVGRFGETYVMDWGLARVLGQADKRDLRLKSPDAVPMSSIHTERRDAIAAREDEPLMTMDGAVVGTPAYMPPEQANGQVELVDKRADVYSIGAMLYQLLTRQMPYVAPGARVSPRTLLALVQMGPPKKVHELAPDVPAELQSICEKAMARDAAKRYADTAQFANDLRAYLEHRVVTAHETGAFAELRKWVERNRPLAASIAAAVLLAVGGTSLVAWQSRQHAQQISSKNAALEERLAEVKRLADVKRVRDLVERADELWPAWPDRVAAMKRWIADAEDVVGRLAVHRASLAKLRASVAPNAPLDTETQWWNDQLTELVASIEALTRPLALPESALAAWKPSADEPPDPLAFVPADATIAAMRRRVDHAAWVEDVSLNEAIEPWREAAARVAKEPRYGGLKLEPQTGLVPIGPDPKSGLEEFWCVETGARPVREEASGRVVERPESGVVLVLLPGGRTTIGSHAVDATHPAGSSHADPDSQRNEQPMQEVELAPFFASKFETTRPQWLRVAGAYPSTLKESLDSGVRSLVGPIDEVSWTDVHAVASRLGQRLPTEAQWEYAARGGSTTPWWCGDDKSFVAFAGNVADQAWHRAYPAATTSEPWDDRFDTVAPVGSFSPNPFGLHDVIGNVWEWCEDEWADDDLLHPVRAGDGLRELPPSAAPRSRAFRGGSWGDVAVNARSATRLRAHADYRDVDVGFRLARPLETSSGGAAK